MSRQRGIAYPHRVDRSYVCKPATRPLYWRRNDVVMVNEANMGWLDSLKALVSSIDTEYDRRIRAASNVKRYNEGGHSAHSADGAHGTAGGHGGHGDLPEQRLEGEGGALGHLQSTAGPQVTSRE